MSTHLASTTHMSHEANHYGVTDELRKPARCGDDTPRSLFRSCQQSALSNLPLGDEFRPQSKASNVKASILHCRFTASPLAEVKCNIQTASAWQLYQLIHQKYTNKPNHTPAVSRFYIDANKFCSIDVRAILRCSPMAVISSGDRNYLLIAPQYPTRCIP